MTSARVLFFYQHFWPDSPPYANMLRVIGRGLVGAGHRAAIVTAQPSYKAGDRARSVATRELLDGIDVRRLRPLPLARSWAPARMLGKALFPLRALVAVAAGRCVGRRHDAIVAGTIPPVVNGLCGLLAARVGGARFVYHLQDIYPEIGVAGGLWRASSARHRVLGAVDRFVTARADRCVVLSDDMRDSLIARGVSPARIRVINNFMLERFDAPSSDASQEADAARAVEAGPRRRIVFAGNLGRFQSLDVLLAGFLDRVAYRDDLELHFLGDGTAKAALVEQADGSAAVHFHGHLDFPAAARFIGGCDAGIVSIAPDIHRYAYPSKTLTYLGLGVPVLALVESGSSLAREVAEHGLGVARDARDAPQVRAAFDALAEWLERHPRAAQQVAAHARTHLSTDAAVARWCALASELVPAPSGEPR